MINSLPTQLMQYVHLSRYARWLDHEKRRETWSETVTRYVNFFRERYPDHFPAQRVYNAIHDLRTMPSMRALMTAGPALDRDDMAGFNCSFVAIDHVRSFDEILYILMCFHPDTMVVTRTGNKRIADIQVGDQVSSIDEATGKAVWKTVTNQIKTSSAHKPKVEIVLDNGHSVRCTADHRWLTTNRGWVEAGMLTVADDLVAPEWQIYRVTNTVTGKSYVGQTTKTAQARFKEHLYTAKSGRGDWHFVRALRKYGEAVWQVDVIDYAFSVEEAAEKERAWISQLDTIFNGYNSTVGGAGAPGYEWSAEQRQRASENAYERTSEHRERQRQVLAAASDKIARTRRTEDYRAAQRERNLGAKNPMYGRKHSEERKAQIQKQMSGASNPFFGRKHSEATKEKIRATKARNAKRGVSA